MARLKKNGNLSGAIGNIVFVNDGDRAYVRAKGNSPKQSQNTKTEAEIFGWVGQKEKLYRDILKDKLGLISYQYQAVKHKTRLRKTVVKETTPSGTTIYRFQNPEALVGFDFNPKMEWERSTNFYPVYQLDTTGTMMIDIPAMMWGEQVKPPKKASVARITLYALATDLNLPRVDVEILSSLSQVLGEKEKLPAQQWSFNIPQDTSWLLIIGVIDFESRGLPLDQTEKSVATYLWARSLKA